MSYRSFGERGDPCSVPADCGAPMDYVCANGQCQPCCLPGAELAEDEDGWWCECPENTKIQCLTAAEVSAFYCGG